VTDANVLLGYVGASTELGGELSLDAEAAQDALAELAAAADLESATEAARGVYRVANATMTREVRGVTVERGHDPRTFSLVAFGGAGPMHAAALAERLDVPRVVVPRACGVLSAFGLLAADEKRDATRTYRVPLADADPANVEAVYDELAAEALADVRNPDAARVERTAALRYAGQSFELDVSVGENEEQSDAERGGESDEPFDPAAVAERFHAAHEEAYGYRMDEAVTLVTLRATATVARPTPEVGYEGNGDARAGEREAFFDGTFRETRVFERERLAAGAEIAGPAIFEGSDSTVVVPPGWTATVGGRGAVTLEVEA
jgi:N-methylhydantoinase A